MFSADLGLEESDASVSRVRFIGSRELHRDLPKVLDTLENPDARFVLTIHSKPKAVLIGAEAFLEILRRPQPGRPSAGTSARRTRSRARIVDILRPLESRNARSNWSGSEPSTGSDLPRRLACGALNDSIPCILRVHQDRGFVFREQSCHA